MVAIFINFFMGVVYPLLIHIELVFVVAGLQLQIIVLVFVFGNL